jgi:ABC-type transporter Mla subunit MlaD
MYKTKNKRNKKHKKTRKYYGGGENAVVVQPAFKPSEGIFDILGKKIGDFASSAFNYIEEKGLRVAGLEKIHNNLTDANGNMVKDSMNKASGAVSNAINNVTSVLKSPEAQESVTMAAQDLAQTGTKLLESFNQVASTPAFKQAVEVAANNVADYTKITVEAMDEPINEAMDKLNEAGTKAASGVTAGLIKVGTDAMAAVPGVGAAVEVGKMLNDGSKAIGDMVEAGSQVAETMSQVIEKTSKNLDKGLDDLEKKKQRVEGLTNQKLNIPQMSNPLTNVSNPLTNVSNPLTNVSNPLTNMTNTATNKMTNAMPKTPINMTGGGLKKLSDIKSNINLQIGGSLAEFHDPIGYQSILKGGNNNKTKKSMVNGKDRKSRRVQFSLE